MNISTSHTHFRVMS